MKLRLIKLRDTLAESFWFLPTVMAFLSAGLALGAVAFDHAIGSGWVKNIGWVWSGGADGARSVLSTVAGSVMTVVSIVFSLTITTLAQTSSHYGPRVLRNFTSDRRVQATLGTFISTFVYCLLVLRTVRSVEESSFVPSLSVTIGIVLALVSLGVLIFFIHHVSQSIQAETLIAGVGLDFEEMLPVFFPEGVGESHPKGQTLDRAHWRDAWRVDAGESGYLQRVDDDALMQLATEHDLQCKVERMPGQFVARDTPLLRVVAVDAPTDEIAEALRACFSLGNHRTRHQDPLYSIQQLVEIAAHALSPGINEPFTALTCLDWLGASVRRVLRREFPAPERRDAAGHVRIVTQAMDFERLWRAAFDQIRIYGASSPDILSGLLHLIASIAPDLRHDAERVFLTRYTETIGLDAAARIENAADSARVAHLLERTLAVLVPTCP